MDLIRPLAAAVLGAAMFAAAAAHADERFIVVSSTTSTENSGLFRYLLPIFKAKSGVAVRVVAQGTGQALDMGKRGDCDVVFVHNRNAELKMVKQGWFVDRHDVMYNDFVIVGPKSDPAQIKGMKDVTAAMKKILAAKALFASRGDRSGTHSAELRLWKAAGVDLAKQKGAWYRSTGSGMGATLNTAAGMNAYALSDRGTWLSFKNPQNLVILVQGDPRLFNQYGVMLVNPAKHPSVKKTDGLTFINWLISPEGQKTIAGYKIDGQELFFPNAKR
jgi:tungstate transport system substrate-binding protein